MQVETLNGAPAEISNARVTAILGVTAVTFFLCLLPFELMPEIPVDIDSKPFFVPLALCALLPARRIGLAIGLGVALGEGLRDLMEGYELDDPIGFFGYVLGFWVASYVFAIAPRNKFVLFLGSVLCAFVQAAIEASSFLLFGAEGLIVTIESTIGNTIMHGVIWGALPLYFLLPPLRGTFESALGFEPRGAPAVSPLEPSSSNWTVPVSTIAWIKDFQFRYPGQTEPVLKGVNLAIAPDTTVLIRGAQKAGHTTLVQALTGLAPEAVGGDATGTRHRPGSYFIVSQSPRDQMTQARPLQQVAEAYLTKGHLPGVALNHAKTILLMHGISEELQQAYIWTLNERDQLIVLICAAIARQPDLLILDRISSILAQDADEIFKEVIAQRPDGAATLILETLNAVPSVASDVELYLDAGKITKVRPSVAIADLSPSQASFEPQESATGVNIPTLQQRQEGWWQRRDPRTKWALFIGLILLIYLSPDWRWMAAACGVGLVTALIARPSPVWLAFALFVQIPNVIGLILLPALAGEGLYSDDLAFGLRLGLGWVAAILFGISLLSTMDIPDMVAGLRGLGLPRSFAFLIGYTFLLIYQSLADFAALLRDLNIDLRALRPWRPGQMLNRLASLFVPLIGTVARRGGIMALASASSVQTSAVIPYASRRMALIDWTLLFLMAATIIAAILS